MLPKQPDQETFNLLTRAVAFLAHARSHIPLGASVDGMIAVHGLDNSVEYLLRILVQHLDMDSVAGKSFDIVNLAELAGAINSFLKEHHSTQLPYIAEIKQLRQVRNLVQHGAVDPRAELRRFETVVTRLYKKVFTQFFGLDPDSLRVSSLVRDESVRAQLRAAEDYIERKQPFEAVVAARDAFELARFNHMKASRIRIFGLPALLEAQQHGKHTQYFFREVIEEIELRALDVPYAPYRRYASYVNHIPSKYNADTSVGYAVMQRDWENADAEFCYQFVADTILKWQNQELAPIYEVSADMNVHSFSVQIGDVRIPDKAGGTFYVDAGLAWKEAFHVDGSMKDALTAVEIGSVCEYRTESRRNQTLERVVFEKCRVLSRTERVLINRPALWEVVLWFETVPLSRHLQVLRDGHLVEENLSLNMISAERLHELAPETIPLEVAERIERHRNTSGPFHTIEDVARVPNITEDQLSWIGLSMTL